MTSHEYRVLEVKVRSFPSMAIPADLGSKVDEFGAKGWELDHCVPVMAKSFFGASYTDSILLFFRRPRA